MLRFAICAALSMTVAGQTTTAPRGAALELIAATALPRGSTLDGVPIGGLSGLDRLPDGTYLAISDDKGAGRAPRFYHLALQIDAARHRMRVRATQQVALRDADGGTFPTDRSVIDPEAIRHAGNGHVLWSSEGSWNVDPARRVQPALYESDANGRILRSFTLPAPYRYIDNRTRGAASNGVLEGLAVGPGGGVYTINEVPAYEDRAPADGPARMRLTAFDPVGGRALRQYLYAIPDGRYSVSELLAVDDRQFLTIERVLPFDMRHGVQARIVLSRVADDTTDILSCAALTACQATAMTREILVDLPGSYRGILIDNLEGMAWGPRLRDGRRTLVVVADDNFSSEETTQFLAFAWRTGKPDR